MRSGPISSSGPNTLVSTAAYDIPDNILFTLGKDSDIAMVLNTAGLAADAELTGVIEGTSDTLGSAANSLLIGNVTDNGDIGIFVSKAGSSHTAFLADGSTGDTILNAATGQSVDIYVAGTKEYDFSATALDLGSNNLTTTGTVDGIDVSAHDVATTGVHGASTNHIAATHTAGQLVNNVVWIAAPAADLTDSNRTTSLAATDLDLTSATSANAKFAILQLRLVMDSISGTAYALLQVRKNGDNPTYTPQIWVGSYTGDIAGAEAYANVIVGMDSGQVMEYIITISGTIQVDTVISVLGYIE